MTKKLTSAFGSQSSNVNDIPTTTTVKGQASYEQGFPPETMLPLDNGGIAPDGKDMNGILKDISANIVDMNQGLVIQQYDDTYSQNIGGYPIGARVTLSDNATVVISTIANNQNNPNSNMTGWTLVTDAMLQTWSGRTQKTENQAFVTSVEKVADLANLTPLSGRPVFVKSAGKIVQFDSKLNKWWFVGSVHKTIKSYDADYDYDGVVEAFKDTERVEVLPGTYQYLQNKNPQAYSFGYVCGSNSESIALTDIVSSSQKVESLSRGAQTATRWDLGFGYAVDDTKSYHPYPNGFFVEPNRQFYYVWHKLLDSANNYYPTLVKKTMSNQIVSEVRFPDDAPQGECFTVLPDNTTYMGGRAQDPKLHVYDAWNGTLKDYFLWETTFVSRQFAYLDPMDLDRVIVLGQKSGTGYVINEYRLSIYTTTDGIKKLTKLKEFPVNGLFESGDKKVAIQGFTALGDNAYILVEPVGSSTSMRYRQKTIRCFRLTDGVNYENKVASPIGMLIGNAYYGDSTKPDANYESEGLCAQTNFSYGRYSSDLFLAIVTGVSSETTVAKSRVLYYRSTLAGENVMMPSVQGMPARGGLTTSVANSMGGSIKQYYFSLKKSNNVWTILQDNYDNAVGLQIIQKIGIEAYNGTNIIAVYLLDLFLIRLYADCSLTAFNYQAKLDRGAYGGLGGGSKSARQVIVFADQSGNVVDPSAIPNGTILEVSLTAIGS